VVTTAAAAAACARTSDDGERVNGAERCGSEDAAANIIRVVRARARAIRFAGGGTKQTTAAITYNI